MSLDKKLSPKLTNPLINRRYLATMELGVLGSKF